MGGNEGPEKEKRERGSRDPNAVFYRVKYSGK
jgi:hypothetical protein